MLKTILFYSTFASAIIFAQIGKNVHVIAIDRSTTREPVAVSRSKVIFHTVLSAFELDSLQPVVPGSWEDQIITGSKLAVKDELILSFGKLVGFATKRASDGDILVARWEGTSQDPTRAIWLYDTPYETIFVLEVDPTFIGPASINQYCENLFTWTGLVKSIKLVRLNPTDDRVSAIVTHVETELGNWNVSFSTVVQGSTGYVAIGISKPTHRVGYPEDAFEVPERFPPLRHLLLGVPRTKLFSELEKSYKSGAIPVKQRANRDRIVMDELLSRGPLSEEEMKQLVIGTMNALSYSDRLNVHTRLRVLLRAMENRNELTSYTRALAKLFIDAKEHFEEFAVGNLLGTMERAKIEFSREAIQLMSVDKFSSLALQHLKHNAKDQDTLELLDRVAVNPKLSEDMDRAKKEIKNRIELQ